MMSSRKLLLTTPSSSSLRSIAAKTNQPQDPVPADGPEPSPFFEPLVRSFVLGLGAGAICEAGHVAFKVRKENARGRRPRFFPFLFCGHGTPTPRRHRGPSLSLFAPHACLGRSAPASSI